MTGWLNWINLIFKFDFIDLMYETKSDSCEPKRKACMIHLTIAYTTIYIVEKKKLKTSFDSKN